MKILKNREGWDGPLCNCNSATQWPHVEYAPTETINIFGYLQPLYIIRDTRSLDNGKQLVFFKDDGTCSNCRMVKWRIWE